MADFLNAVVRGAGSPSSTLSRFIGGRGIDLVDTGLGGTIGNDTNREVASNAACRMGDQFFVAAGFYQRASIADPSPRTWTTISGLQTARSGILPVLTSAGPCLVFVSHSGTNNFPVASRHNVLSGVTDFFQSTSGVQADRLVPYRFSTVFGTRYIQIMKTIFATSSVCKILDVETGTWSDAVGLEGSFGEAPTIAFLNGNAYSCNLGAGGEYLLRVLLGGVWVQVAQIGATLTTGSQIQIPMWERNGFLYIMLNDGNLATGRQLWRWSEATGPEDVTLTELNPLLRTGGGLGAVADSRNWAFGFYLDQTSPSGTIRHMLQVAPGLKTAAPGVILFEHGDTAIDLVGDTDLSTGSYSLTWAPYYGNYLQWRSGDLWALAVSPPSPVQGGMLRTYRIGGDPGNADKIVRLRYAQPVAGQQDQATLLVPGGGLGQPGASLVEEAPGVWRVDGWDANGVDNLQVIHATLTDGLQNASPSAWHLTVGES